MNVTRTPAGISNEHLFHKSEAVVYVEGGKSFKGSVPAASTDLLFWRSLFDLFAVGHCLHFKPRCGKQELLPIADGIANGSLTAVVVCMDRDHDHVRGLRQHPRVLYTFGYSWENDVWSAEVIEEAFYMLCGVDRSGFAVRADIDRTLRHFAVRMRWPVYADVLASLHSESTIPRGKLKCVTQSKGCPSIDSEFLLKCVRMARAKTHGVYLRLPEAARVELWRDVYGHVLGYFCYSILAGLVKRHCGQNTSRDTADAVAIRLNRELMRADVQHHHQQQFAELYDRQ